jgi:glycosyltransferase involved in cell wall biosynthesis
VPGRVVLAANSSWNIVNFRTGLIRALKAEGYEPVIVAPKDHAADKRMAALDVEYVEIDLQRSGLNPLADFALLRKYFHLFNSLRAVAVLGFTIKPNIYGALAAERLAIPFIANVSGLGTVFIKRGLILALASRLYRLALRRAAVVFFQNPDDQAEFIGRRLVRPEQARLLPGSGIDLERFSEKPVPGGPPTFLFIGRLLGDKGVREFVAAARQLRGRGSRFQLLGPLDEGNRSAVSRTELDEWLAKGVVEFLGETDDVRPFIEHATAVVLPSYREGLPRSLLEAAAMGRPLVATDVPGCREVVENGINGFRCTVRDPASLAAAMAALAALTDEQRQAMGDASRRMVEERFGENVVIAAYLDALGKLTGVRS